MVHQQVVPRTQLPYCLVPPEEMEALMWPYGVRRCQPAEIAPAMSLAERLVDKKLTRAEVVYTLDTITGMTIWVTGDPVAGLYVSVPLTEDGVIAAEAGEFTPDDPELSHVAPARTPIFGSYLGVYAGATKAARRAIMTASANIRQSHFATVPCFARAATSEGRESMLAMGFRRVAHGEEELFVLDPAA